jgi:hypothetical protein
MSITRFNLSIGALLAMALVAILVGSFGVFVKANPSYFLRSPSTSTTFPIATSTQAVFIAGGLGTTTLTLDLGVGGPQGADSASLLIQLTSTTSQPTLNIDIQYSQDGVDWYADPLGMDFQAVATGTPVLGSIQTLQFIFASSTINRAALFPTGTATTSSNRIVNLKTPTRYIRAVNYVSPGANTAAALWEEFVAKRQSN